jgi:hypothetical protein
VRIATASTVGRHDGSPRLHCFPPEQQQVLAGIWLTPAAPLDEQERSRIAAASLASDSAEAVEVGV